jgi:thiamine biosynthesis protein ThiC
MGNQMSIAILGMATGEMVHVARDEVVNFDTLLHGIAKGSFIISKNIEREQQIKVVGIGQSLSLI